MRLVILDDYNKASEWAAKYVRNKILSFKPGPDKYFILGLPTGRLNSSLTVVYSMYDMFYTGSTPLGMYRKLIEYYKTGLLSFKYVITFNMDEYVGLPESHPESYHAYMWENFFRHIDIEARNVHILNGNAQDLVKECEEYEKKIKAAGGVELFIGGKLAYCAGMFCKLQPYLYFWLLIVIGPGLTIPIFIHNYIAYIFRYWS